MSQFAVEHERVLEGDDAYRAVVEQHLHGHIALGFGYRRSVRGVDREGVGTYRTGYGEFEIGYRVAKCSSVSEAKRQIEVDRELGAYHGQSRQRGVIEAVVVAQRDDVASSAEAVLHFGIIGSSHTRRREIVPCARGLEALNCRRGSEHKCICAERGGRIAREVHRHHGERRGDESLPVKIAKSAPEAAKPGDHGIRREPYGHQEA